MNDSDRALASALAKAIAALCVRNTFLEDLHSGATPSSKSGDNSDVKVVMAFGAIPRHGLSRISDAGMKLLMKEVVDKIFTFLCRQENPAFMEAFLRLGGRYAARWDEPQVEEGFVLPVRRGRRKPPKSGDS